jgi:hypothetical protein
MLVIGGQENVTSRQHDLIRDYAYLSATAKKGKHTIKVSNKKQPHITEQKWRTLCTDNICLPNSCCLLVTFVCLTIASILLMTSHEVVLSVGNV